MRLSWVFWKIFIFLLYPAVLSSLLLYFYPALFGCDFPAPSRDEEAACLIDPNARRKVTVQAEVAPFRLLVFADPQLEGDSSLPKSEDPTFPSLYRLWSGLPSQADGPRDTLGAAVGGFFTKDIPHLLWSYRKRLDLFGNDYYLAHIYRSLNWWLQPTHVTVLGDLIGSQWVSDKEFEGRGWRFWNRVFRRGHRVADDKTEGLQELLGEDQAWSRRIINIAGNHDIGYAGDLSNHRIDRFERIFGKANWDVTFQLPLPTSTSKNPTPFDSTSPPSLRLIILNSMNLDGPVHDLFLQSTTYTFINSHILATSKPVGDLTATTLLLTHIPLHKPAGVCVDPPFFNYSAAGTIREQNHLSPSATRSVLEGVFGMSPNAAAPAAGRGRPGLILTGHDHEGCDVYHHVNNNAEWAATRWRDAGEFVADEQVPGVREITVRSMMGSFGGNAGMLSAWFDAGVGEWRFEYATCPLGVQHLWWGVHVLGTVTGLMLVGAVVTAVLEELEEKKVELRRTSPSRGDLGEKKRE